MVEIWLLLRMSLAASKQNKKKKPKREKGQFSPKALTSNAVNVVFKVFKPVNIYMKHFLVY